MRTEKASDNERNKVRKTIFMTIGALGLLLAGILGYGTYWAFFDMSRLPTGDCLTEESSPDGKYTLKAYVADGGATSSYTIRGELVFNQENKKAKNIYWNHKEDSADIEWLDHDTVMINGHTLDVPREKFDFRNQ